MDKKQSRINENQSENFNIITSHPNSITPTDEDIINLIRQNSKNCYKITKDKAIEYFDERNMDYLKANRIDNTGIIDIIQNNAILTPDQYQKEYWDILLNIINSIKKTNNKVPYPSLPFGKSLEDKEFLDLFKRTIDYACYSLPKKDLKEIKETLKEICKNTNNIFTYPRPLKEIKENGLLTFIMSQNYDEKEESISLIRVNNCSITPLIKLKFEKNNTNHDLDKDELKEILTSKVLLKFYRENLREFTPKFDEKIKDEESLKKCITSYINNYNIYFANLPTNIFGITIHTGNIYLKSKYIKEYFNIYLSNNIDEDNLIIIREKIVLNIKHGINHSLLREIDTDMKENFFLKSKNNNSKNALLIFKDKFLENKKHKYPSNESGNCFDFAFYKGYYFVNLFKEEAIFFMDVKNMKDENEYSVKFNEMMANKSKNINWGSSINKFKKSNNDYPCCFKSRILMHTTNSNEIKNK